MKALAFCGALLLVAGCQPASDPTSTSRSALSGLTYSTNPATYTVGQIITPNVPSYDGGTVLEYMISSPLPNGLLFSTTSGVISGTPTAPAPSSPYTVNAMTAEGPMPAILTITVNDVPPTGCHYSTNPATYTVGQAITNNAPSCSGGQVVLYSLAPSSPALPAGLSIDPSTGVISGTPTAASPTATYTINATNSGGSYPFPLTILVNDVPPTDCHYSTTSATYTVGKAITNNVPSCSGGQVLSYSVAPSSPALPAGLAIDPGTGVISGTPTAVSPTSITYIVIATNSGGTYPFLVTLTVNDVPPADCHYSTNPATYTVGQAISNNVPSCGGGRVVSYSVSPSSPALPAGLGIDSTTGVISGTPAAISSTTTYTIIATNSGGSPSFPVTITVNDVPPTNCYYSSNPATYTIGQLIPNNVPSCSGGRVVSYAVSPSSPTLPTGLGIDLGTGVIFGIPAVISSNPVTYTIIATNSGGSFPFSVTITVNDVPPTNCHYSTNPVTYTVGQAILNNVPSCSGGRVVSYSVFPGFMVLPAGLSLNPSAGTISGTPTAVSPTITYTIVAKNSGGSYPFPVTITVNDVPPANCHYSTNPATYTVGQKILDNVPSCSGGRAISYSVASSSPALPAGLGIDSSTGVISGTPTAVSSTPINYIVIATNSGGAYPFLVTITVNDVPPTNCHYSTNPATYTVGRTIPNNAPSCSGGRVVSYAVAPGSPALPTGLGIDQSTGAISGTPTAVSSTTTYGIIATNSGGSYPFPVTITVNDAPPTGCHYPNGSVSWPRGLSATSGQPTCTAGGRVVSWSINSAYPLPSGLSFNTSTGTISGVPTVASAASTYPVSASNTGGSYSFSITIEIKASDLIGTSSAISAGADHTCAVVNGDVWCWGNNGSGQLGNGTNAPSPVPIKVSGLPPGAQAVAAGADHTCALVQGGVWCWGHNSWGQLGDGSTIDRWAPVQVQTLPSGVHAIAAGSSFTCAVVQGAAKCWGDNNSGQLGINSLTPQSLVPAQVYGLGSGVQAITAGGNHACAIVEGGARCWGRNDSGQLGAGAGTVFDTSTTPISVSGLTAGVQAISAGHDHTCALVSGIAYCWGQNWWGQIGNGSTSTSSSTPLQVSILPPGVLAISATGRSSCAIYAGGASCWGLNSAGQLGNATTSNSSIPVGVQGLDSGVQAVTVGAAHACALVNGGLRCWGSNASGQLGVPSITSALTPVQVPGLNTGLQAITSGFYHSCALASGGVQCWGGNWVGQLGNGSPNGSSSLIPTRVFGLASGVQAITAGFYHSCAIVNGSARCWGYNDKGQLGDGTTYNRTTPTPVTYLGPDVLAMAGGGNHTCVIAGFGTVWCWGKNTYGQLGDGTTTNRLAPVSTQWLTSNTLAISAGQDHTCAIASAIDWWISTSVQSRVLCWGYNGHGQLGDGTTTNSPTPAFIAFGTSIDIRSARAIATGTNHTCALQNGVVWCWGDNGAGQLGDGTTTERHVPVTVFTNAQAIAAGNNHTCALSDGKVSCWGSNASGQLGNNTTTNSPFPYWVPNLTGVQAITAKGDSTCAIANGRTWCWGSNLFGELGANASANSPVPVLVYPWAP